MSGHYHNIDVDVCVVTEPGLPWGNAIVRKVQKNVFCNKYFISKGICASCCGTFLPTYCVFIEVMRDQHPTRLDLRSLTPTRVTLHVVTLLSVNNFGCDRCACSRDEISGRGINFLYSRFSAGGSGSGKPALLQITIMRNAPHSVLPNSC